LGEGSLARLINQLYSGKRKNVTLKKKKVFNPAFIWDRTK